MNVRSPALLLALALLVCGVLVLTVRIPGFRAAGVATDAAPAPVASARSLAPLESGQDRQEPRTTATSVQAAAGTSTVATEGFSTIEAKVLWRGDPLAGTNVDIFRLADEDYGFLAGEQESSFAARVRTDGEGVARFDHEPSGRHGLLATGPSGSAARVLILVGADRETRRIVLALGSAGLEGIVYAPQGGSPSGCRVLVRLDSLARDGQVWFLGRADGAGNYRVGGLGGGPEHSVTAAVLDLRLPEGARLVLGSEEWRRLDFGSPGGEARWSGVVRLKSGRAVAGPARLGDRRSKRIARGNQPGSLRSGGPRRARGGGLGGRGGVAEGSPQTAAAPATNRHDSWASLQRLRLGPVTTREELLHFDGTVKCIDPDGASALALGLGFGGWHKVDLGSGAHQPIVFTGSPFAVARTATGLRILSVEFATNYVHDEGFGSQVLSLNVPTSSVCWPMSRDGDIIVGSANFQPAYVSNLGAPISL